MPQKRFWRQKKVMEASMRQAGEGGGQWKIIQS